MAKVQINPHLEKFYKGFHDFSSLDVQGDKLIFKLPSPSLVQDAYLAAQKRINELCLPLEAKLTGHRLLSNTFIVKENDQNTFEVADLLITALNKEGEQS